MEKQTEDPELTKTSAPNHQRGGVNRAFANRRGTLFLFGFVGIAGVTWLLSVVRVYLEPSLYEGTAVIEFRLPHSESDATGDYEREFEILQSQVTLALVVEKFGLDQQWDVTSHEANQLLAGASTFEALANSRLARIKVHHTDAALAARLADGIAEAYERNRSAQRMKIATDHLATLDNQISLMKDKTEQARVKLLDIIEHYEGSPIEGSPIMISGGKSIDPRALSEGEFADYLNARRQLIVAEEGTAAFERLRDQTEALERQRLEASIEMNNRGKATITHERAVIPTVPALPDVEAEITGSYWRALVFGLVGALLLAFFVPMLRANANPAATPDPR